MAHSKRNTSLAFFTAHERSALNSTWGTRSTRLTRDSFLPFGACALCLLGARDPVACPRGDLFCRECAVANLLAQRKDIKRAGKGAERERKEREEEAKRGEDEARRRAVEEFEKVQAGLERRLGRLTDGADGRRIVGRGGGKVTVEEEVVETEGGEKRKRKRKFEIDEEELMRVALEDRGRAKKALSEEKKLADEKAQLPSFWVPSQTPTSNANVALHDVTKTAKRHPVCPASTDSDQHEISLKTLVAVNFTEETDRDTGSKMWSCPSCRKALSNATKAMLAVPCGHVLCKPCVAKFLTPNAKRDAYDADGDLDGMRCYVCEADLSGAEAPIKNGKDDTESKEARKEKIKPGLVQIRSEGTGFAGGGKNMVKREGVAFQC